MREENQTLTGRQSPFHMKIFVPVEKRPLCNGFEINLKRPTHMSGFGSRSCCRVRSQRRRDSPAGVCRAMPQHLVKSLHFTTYMTKSCLVFRHEKNPFLDKASIGDFVLAPCLASCLVSDLIKVTVEVTNI